MHGIILIIAGAMIGAGVTVAVGLYVFTRAEYELDEADRIRYGYSVNGEAVYSATLPPESERDAGPYVVYYGYLCEA